MKNTTGSDPVALQIKTARHLAKRGKGPKTIARRTGLSIADARTVVQAISGAEQRRSHQDRLSGMLKRIELLLPRAEGMYSRRPSGYHATALVTLTAEIRAMMSHIDRLKRPEQMALAVIQKVLQPFVKATLQGLTEDIRASRARCLAVATSPQTERAIKESFNKLALDIGISVHDKYAAAIEQAGLVLECDIDSLRKLARESAAAEALLNKEKADKDSNVVQFSSRRSA